MTERFDVVVVGAGPAGYVAALRCAQLGLKTACVDDWRDPDGRPALGGTCLNAGCIPSKALLESSERYVEARHDGARHGLKFDNLSLDLSAMMANKNRIVSELTAGVGALFKANGIAAIAGRGRLLAGKRVEIAENGAASRTLEADHVILAAGSRPTAIGVAPLTEGLIVDSTGALAFDAVPGRLGIIGAGVIGLELGSVWRRLGAEVVLLEAQERFLAIADEQVAKEAHRQFTAQGLDIRLGARVTGTGIADNRVRIAYQDVAGEHHEEVDKLIVAVGRRPNSNGLAADEAGLLLDEWGYVHVDAACRTNLPGVYAIGDLVRGPMLAHKGSEEGVRVAETIAGRPAQVNHETIPAVIYTLPEIAWVGKTEQQLKSAGEEYTSGVFPFAASGRAKALGVTSGFVKVLADAGTDWVRGVHMIGPNVSELIATAVLAMEFGASSEDVALTVFAHPTLSEALHEAALAVGGRALHIAPRRSVARR
jgi:dihydrolipoamide dehydrogenase